jgi:hypothetical protein
MEAGGPLLTSATDRNWSRSNRAGTSLTSSYADYVIESGHENLSIPDLTCSGGFHNCSECRFQKIGIDYQADDQFG